MKKVFIFPKSYGNKLLFKTERIKYNLVMTDKYIEIMKHPNNMSTYDWLNDNNYSSTKQFHLALLYEDE